VAHSAQPQSVVPVIAGWHQRGHVIILAVIISFVQTESMRLGCIHIQWQAGSIISTSLIIVSWAVHHHGLLFQRSAPLPTQRIVCLLQSLMLKSQRSNCCKAVKASAHFLPWLHERFGSAADLASDLYHKRRFAASGFLC